MRIKSFFATLFTKFKDLRDANAGPQPLLPWREGDKEEPEMNPGVGLGDGRSGSR